MKQSTISRPKWIALVVFIVFIVLIQLVISYSHSIETWYSSGLYPFIANTLRILLGWLPFSVGDIGYMITILVFAFGIVRFFRKMFKRKLSWKRSGYNFFRIVLFLAIVYVVFYSFWGLNYYRKGIAFQLNIERKPYTTDELMDLTKSLAEQTSQYRKSISSNSEYHLDKSELFGLAKTAYDSVQQTYGFLQFKHKSTKASLFGVLGNYLGYTGYYNPFSGEAQINMKTPDVVLPAVVCHEMAHQLGYATEDEANFVGYLAASHSHNKVFLYSIYLDLYRYAASELFVRDSSKYILVKQSLDTLVKKDLKDIRDYKVINVIYGQYLKANNQPQGIDTYSDVISLLMAYRRKYGKI
ncbi:MAG: DUF3810 domain-containing protein [Pseudopedobacter saltans]|uniref:DUF3810 domain-containing protein n=1 Tax=Pseudopedobacter saltans TaxID=151895 RepID=A0A2W5GQ61_9SPHI|nr:MAG: DUF3810 domain-containing protein [Pseudopedobacter saltans]